MTMGIFTIFSFTMGTFITVKFFLEFSLLRNFSQRKLQNLLRENSQVSLIEKCHDSLTDNCQFLSEKTFEFKCQNSHRENSHISLRDLSKFIEKLDCSLNEDLSMKNLTVFLSESLSNFIERKLALWKILHWRNFAFDNFLRENRLFSDSFLFGQFSLREIFPTIGQPYFQKYFLHLFSFFFCLIDMKTKQER